MHYLSSDTAIPEKQNARYSLIQMKCQGGDKYALSITVKFDQSTRRFGRINFARLFKLTKRIALLFYLLSPYLLSCMSGLRNVRKNMYIINLRALEHRSRYDEFRRRWKVNSISQACAAHQRPIISKCQHSTKFGNTVHVFAYFRNSLLARKIIHLANIET